MSNREDFEQWLASLDEYIEWFTSAEPERNRVLDFSVDSLDYVERLILNEFPSTESMLAAEHAELVNALACYIGETFRIRVGGKWDICLGRPEFAYAGIPILTGGGVGTTSICPLALATTVADRRSGNYLRSVLEGCIDNENI